MKSLLDWVDQRTGSKKLLHEALFENVPGGARWRYAWGSTLLFCFAIQVVTGLFLWLAYSPSSQTAWESVYYIQHEMLGGWFLRGLHHYTAQAMTVLLVLHLLQVVIDGAYKAPREVNFWTGVLLLLLVLALSLTGYLLPWDQKGYWATNVATGLAGSIPVIGPHIERLVVGASDYGHHTLTRFFALHAGVIPGAIIAFIVAHVYLFRRHGLTAKLPKKKPDAPFWPDQVFRDAVVCLAVLLVILFFNFRSHGAELDAPADPSEPYPARPEWYFLFLFQMLKLPVFKGSMEIVGVVVVPTIVIGLLVAMPYLGRSKSGHRFNLGFLWAMLGGIAVLTFLAINEDRNNPTFQADVRAAKREAERMVELAAQGIPTTGAITLLREDALIQGPKIFAKNCASCHRFDGHDGLGNQPKDAIAGSDLKGFASREWLAGLLDPTQVDGPHYFGGTKFKTGKMVDFVKKDVAELTSGANKDQIQKVVAALSAEAKLPAQEDADRRDAALIAEGKKLIAGDTIGCAQCHKFHDDADDPVGPDLTGYGSREWLTAFVSNPEHERFYGERNDRMPAFGEKKSLTEKEIGLVVDWLRGVWYRPVR